MAAKQSERIKLWGIVQGVGFRPYVAKIAARLGMKGRVLNMGGLVEITVTDTPERITDFIDRIIEEKPAPAEIVHIKREPTEPRHFDSFTIVGSDDGGNEAVMLPPDMAICPNCLGELYSQHDPRYQHPFISCMVCGPRYTITEKIPYDRENTTMSDFPMCGFCEEQYTSPEDRRYHAQTISCHDCGPQLIWKRNEANAGANASTDVSMYANAGVIANTSISEDSDAFINAGINMSTGVNADTYERNAAILDETAAILRGGGVIAFKSMGGYNLMADPLNNEAVAKLREIKHRESKPFAVMFKSIGQIGEFCDINEAEARLISSSARPIILLEHKELPYDEINRSRFIGSFLPSMAAQYMLLDRVSPLISTSANLSDMPMITDDDKMISLMKRNGLIDGVLYNTRRIVTKVDDSVARVIDGQPQMIRRSKGYAPVPLHININIGGISELEDNGRSGVAVDNCKTNTTVDDGEPNAAVHEDDPMIFAAGPQLKNSFALTKGEFVYVSQFFGDMDTVENQRVYEESVSKLSELFRIKPDSVVCDMHPGYFTTGFAEKYAEENGLPIMRVQHHHAHVASVMAENDLTGNVIGVSFDGTGYGTDGAVWGGEFFLCEGARAARLSHLKYVDMIGGDASVRDACRSALSYIHAYENGYLDDIGGDEICPDISDIIEFGKDRLLREPNAETVMAALNARVNTVKSSSMGRLFDAVAALLGICGYNDYEGKCAIMLEDAAAFASKYPGQRPECDLALAFHHRIIDMVAEQCRAARARRETGTVALTGGTFQNKILMEGILDKLRSDGFTPYYNISVSPNDGGVALGQAYIASLAHGLKEPALIYDAQP